VHRRTWLALAAWGIAPAWVAAQPAGPARAPARDAVGASQRVGQLMVLSQRVGKVHALDGLGIERDDARRIRVESLDLAARLVGELSSAPAVPEAAKPAVQALGPAWQRARDLLATAPTPASLDRLLVLDNQLLGIANEASTHLLRLNLPDVTAVDSTARMAMLSQRIAKFHFAALWGVAPKLAASQIARARQDFLGLQKGLQSAARGPGQQEALAALQSQWVFFEAALENASLGAEAGLHVRLARASEAILRAFDELGTRLVRSA
jgi:hypothetical protein